MYESFLMKAYWTPSSTYCFFCLIKRNLSTDINIYYPDDDNKTCFNMLTLSLSFTFSIYLTAILHLSLDLVIRDCSFRVQHFANISTRPSDIPFFMLPYLIISFNFVCFRYILFFENYSFFFCLAFFCNFI